MREIGSEFQLIPLSDNYFASIGKVFLSSLFIRSGRESLGLIAESITGEKDILIPSYVCPSMVEPFAERNWGISYYELHDDLSIDNDSLLSLVQFKKPSLVLLMSYFCAKNYSDLLEQVKEISPQTKILFDFTHCVLDFEDIKTDKIDFYVASLRKWFGISSGAILLTNDHINEEKICKVDATDYLLKKESALSKKELYLSCCDEELKHEYKNLITEADSLLGYNKFYYANDEDIKRILSVNAGIVRNRRNNNIRHLWNLVKDIDGVRSVVDFDDSHLIANFMLPLLIENRKIIQGLLAEQGIYSQVIWGIPDEAKKCTYCNYVYKHILCIPIDQRYNYWDIEYIGSTITNIFSRI